MASTPSSPSIESISSSIHQVINFNSTSDSAYNRTKNATYSIPSSNLPTPIIFVEDDYTTGWFDTLADTAPRVYQAGDTHFAISFRRPSPHQHENTEWRDRKLN